MLCQQLLKWCAVYLCWAVFLSQQYDCHVSASTSLATEERISVTDGIEAGSGTCTWEDRHTCKEGTTYQDSRLFSMDVPPSVSRKLNSKFLAYIEPDVSSMYNETKGTLSPIETSFKGVFAKFINMSPKRVKVDWEQTPGGTRVFTSLLDKFSGGGTASFPGHRFIVYDEKTSEDLLPWEVRKGNSLYTYDPYHGVETLAEEMLSKTDMQLYRLQLDNLKFNDVYQEFTGRQWLALYGMKEAPRYHMWPADFFGQTHVIESRETHLLELPPSSFAKVRTSPYGSTVQEREKLQKYRNPNQKILALNMTAVSVIPRVFEIPNFLSKAEVDHILDLASGIRLGESTTGGNAASSTKASGRTSRNSWIPRTHSVIIDSIYRRAADLLQIDEALLRSRFGNETNLLPESKVAIAERLQLVHYAEGQQYTPHHDFMIPSLSKGQPTRFATVLFYLNEPEMGGETSFPRWLNGKEHKILQVTPEVGKAVLFYNQLPDGNYDERSLHSAKAVLKGEKWLTNLWVWDPYK
ncbi:prolyl 4-hydroxylase alpha subunit [Nitzschia inconspicua]|uniref:Prolyl 4-hydroxylase alpha subunit n=1 Tax=Nitzschia inconspicua TaxID=303405 RepID=A0A9K3KUW7_9STRA|nr:prolyl 4-hydroxylase alpha subunit [Nitzschia inconspicua]